MPSTIAASVSGAGRAFMHSSYGARARGCRRMKHGDVMRAQRNLRRAVPEMQLQYRAAVSRDGVSHRSEDLTDILRVDAARQKESLGARAQPIAGTELALRSC